MLLPKVLLSLWLITLSLHFSAFQILYVLLVFKRECFVLSARRVSSVQLCNLPYLTLQSDPFCVAICVIWCCHLRHFMRWNASYCNVFWLILSANLLDFVRRFHFSKVLSSVFRLSVRHFPLGMNITKWEHSGYRLMMQETDENDGSILEWRANMWLFVGK